MSAEDVEVYVRREDRTTLPSPSAWSSLKLVPRRNDAGRWTLVTTSPDDAAALSPPMDAAGRYTGARGVIIRRADRDGNPVTVESGWLEPGGISERHDGNVHEWTFSGWLDTKHMEETLCWPRPASAITAQVDRDDVRTGPASNRIRDYFIANVVTRLQIPGAAGGNQLNLGPSGTSRARMRPLLEVAQEIAGRSLNFAVRQRDSDRALFLYQWLPVDRRLSVQFSPALGTVRSWEHTPTPATATRVIIGAGGEGAARAFREYIGNVSEGEMGGVRKVERFKDRRDLDPTNPNPGDDWLAEALADATEFLEESRSRSSFKIDVQGSGYLYGIDYTVGDLVRAYIDQDSNGQPIGLVDDLVEEVEVTWDSTGERTVVKIGNTEEHTRRLELMLRKALAKLRFLEGQQ